METTRDNHYKSSLNASPHSDYDKEEAMAEEIAAAAAETQPAYSRSETLASQISTLASSQFPSALGGPLGMLPTMPGGLNSIYPGLDTLSMATALQSATMGLYAGSQDPITAGFPGMSAAPWGKYLNHITNRKRRSTPVDSDIETQPKLQKRSSQGTEINSTSNSPPNPAGSESNEPKDNSYWDRRRKNNEAAKRSRDARRQKEEEIAMRAAYLEQENVKLRAQIAVLKNESAKLHFLLFNRSTTNASGSSISSGST